MSQPTESEYMYSAVAVDNTTFAVTNRTGTGTLALPAINAVERFFTTAQTKPVAMPVLSSDWPSLMQALECVHVLNPLGLNIRELVQFRLELEQYKSSMTAGSLRTAIKVLYRSDAKAPGMLIDWVQGIATRALMNSLSGQSKALVQHSYYQNQPLEFFHAVVARVVAQMLLDIQFSYKLSVAGLAVPPNTPIFSTIRAHILTETVASLEGSAANRSEPAVRLNELVQVATGCAKIEGIVRLHGSVENAISRFDVAAGNNQRMEIMVAALYRAADLMGMAAK